MTRRNKKEPYLLSQELRASLVRQMDRYTSHCNSNQNMWLKGTEQGLCGGNPEGKTRQHALIKPVKLLCIGCLLGLLNSVAGGHAESQNPYCTRAETKIQRGSTNQNGGEENPGSSL